MENCLVEGVRGVIDRCNIDIVYYTSDFEFFSNICMSINLCIYERKGYIF